MAMARLHFPRLVDGVSRQPAPQRAPSFVEEMDNATPDFFMGLSKRPGTAKRFYGNGTYSAMTHDVHIASFAFNVGNSTALLVLSKTASAYGATVFIHDKVNDVLTQGTAYTDSGSTLKTYIGAAGFKDLKFCAIQGKDLVNVVIVNTTVTVAMDSGTPTNLDDAKLPFVLQCSSAGVLTDVTSTFWTHVNPDTRSAPNFIGRRCTGIAAWQNRLALSFGNLLILSEAGDPGFLWEGGATATDADSIELDIFASSATLHTLASFGEDLVCLAYDGIYVITAGDNVVKEGNLRVRKVTDTIASPITPVILNGNLVYVEKARATATLMALTQRDYNELNLTQLSDGYISETIDALRVQGDTVYCFDLDRAQSADARPIYILSQKKAGNEIVQNAVHEWFIGNPTSGVVRDIMVSANHVFFLWYNAYSGDTSLHSMDVASNLATQRVYASPPPSTAYTEVPLSLLNDTVLYLDFMEHTTVVDGVLTVPPEFNAVSKVDFITDECVVVRRDTGAKLNVTLAVGGDYVVSDPEGGVVESGTIEVVIGVPFDFKVTLSKQYPRDNNGIVLAKDRLQYRNLSVVLEDSVSLDVRVSTPYRADIVHTIRSIEKNATPYTISAGDICYPPTEIDIEDTLYIYGDSRETTISLENSDYYGVTIADVSIEALAYKRFK